MLGTGSSTERSAASGFDAAGRVWKPAPRKASSRTVRKCCAKLRHRLVSHGGAAMAVAREFDRGHAVVTDREQGA